MKKKILFIISNLESGGVSKSMSSLLNVVDTSLYDVDCFILNPSGVFLSSIPKSVNIISDERTAFVFSEFPANIFNLVRKGWILDAFIRSFAAFFMLFNKGIGGWLLSKRIHKIAKHYDLAVDYNGQHQLYYLVDFVKATKKVTFFHNDYSKWNYYYSMDQKYYSKVDKIYTVSETCVDALKMYFPNDGSKIELFENISSLKLINELALFPFEGLEEFSFVTVGHLTERKGTRLAIEVAHILKNKGLKFHWYFIGKDTEDHNYNQLVKLKKLEKNIHFVGVLPNPYPYIKNATIMVHLASYEGKSIALDEAKILCKPIVVTNFSTVNDQFQNGYNASIVSFNAHEIAETLLELVNNPSLQQQYSQNLRNDCKDNSHEIEKLYHLIN